MIKLLTITLAATLALAAAARAQDAGAGSLDQPAAPLPYEGPIVGGKKIQPTQSEIMDRLMQQRENGQLPAGSGGPPPAVNDKELDELYQQLLQQSSPGGGQ